MSFPFMKDVQLPHYKEDCTAAFFDAIRRLDMESVSQFIEAKPPGFLSSLVDAQGNSPLHVALQVAVAQAATLREASFALCASTSSKSRSPTSTVSPGLTCTAATRPLPAFTAASS